MIAPRLANGDLRVNFWSRLPEPVKEGLRNIAKREQKSMSWVIEEVIIDYFGLRRPKYKEKKNANQYNKRKSQDRIRIVHSR